MVAMILSYREISTEGSAVTGGRSTRFHFLRIKVKHRAKTQFRQHQRDR
ncbi:MULTISPECIES: hypothetical protein [unclassified Microcoleus]